MIYSFDLVDKSETHFQLEVMAGNSIVCAGFPKFALRDLVNLLNEYCLECGAHDPMQDEPQWHKSTCSINEGE